VNGVVLNFKDERDQRNFMINPASVNNNNDKKAKGHLFEIDSKTPKIELKKNSERKISEKKELDKKELEKRDSDRDFLKEREREKEKEKEKQEDLLSKYDKKYLLV